MNSMIASWEDEDNNRQIQFSVDYNIEDSQIDIVNVTPRQVDFTCENTDSIGVHTAKGRELLAGKIEASGRLAEIKNEIARKEGLLASV
ncbi:MAG: hypothetical protein AAGA30_11935 [Planctomycetota bacterium]